MDLLPETFNPEELLLRAVYPANRRPDFWKDGRLSSAALKDKNGLSVERTYDRSLEESIRFMLTHLTGNIVALTQDACESVDAIVVYLPSFTNKYHCEIHGSRERKVLNSHQAHIIAQSAKLVCSVSISTT